MELRTRSADSVFVQIAVTFDPGWTAIIDGQPTTIHETASGQMGLVAPAGDRLVRLRYRDRNVFVGLTLSVLGLFVAVALWARGRPARNRLTATD